MQQALKALDRVGPAHLRPFADADAAFAWMMRTMVPSSLVLSRSRYSESCSTKRSVGESANT